MASGSFEEGKIEFDYIQKYDSHYWFSDSTTQMVEDIVGIAESY
ncbi:MAG: hypothetical protein V5A72_03235 [Candidatus Nanohaloarchaea archaeon]